jgi:hypothetical protein
MGLNDANSGIEASRRFDQRCTCIAVVRDPRCMRDVVSSRAYELFSQVVNQAVVLLQSVCSHVGGLDM